MNKNESNCFFVPLNHVGSLFFLTKTLLIYHKRLHLDKLNIKTLNLRVIETACLHLFVQSQKCELTFSLLAGRTAG